MKYLKTYNESLEERKITCGVYLFDKNNLLLIQHPTKFRPTVWGVPKGRVDEGETELFEVAKRELFEETGIVLDDYTIVSKEEFNEVRYNETNKYLKGFFVKIEEDLSDFNLHCDSMVYRNGEPVFPEVDEWKWVTIEEAKEIFSSDKMTNFQIDNLNRCDELLNTTLLESFDINKMDDVKDCFLSVNDMTYIKYSMNDYVGGFELSIGLSHRVTPSESGTSKWGVKYKELINGDEIAEEIANSISICTGMGFNITRAEIAWINGGEWKLTNTDKEGDGPGLLTKIFEERGIIGPIDLINQKAVRARYSTKMLPEFIIDKGTRLRHIKLIFNS
jgi:8-oxo-dGTP pyrophosphatase MutT (NUDIX family)